MMDAHQVTRGEILQLVFRLGIVSAVTFFSIKFLMTQIDPTNAKKKEAKKKALELIERLRNKGIPNISPGKLSDYELMIAAHLVHPDDITISWEDIAGLESIIKEIRETVILPISRQDLFRESRLTQPPKGVLLHGPPGCGKTLIAKATAKEAGTRFINLDVSILTDKWYGESQKLAAAVFSLAVKVQPCIIFIDEIDSFLRVRNSTDHEATAMMKAQFMSFWDGLVTDNTCTVLIMGATNRPQDLDKAILRRMPATFHVSMPNAWQRKHILELILREERTEAAVDIESLARRSEGFSGSDLHEMCRNAAVYRLRELSSDTQELRPITMDELCSSLTKMKEGKAFCDPSVPRFIRDSGLD